MAESKKVYVVWNKNIEWDPTAPRRVFSTKELAQKWLVEREDEDLARTCREYELWIKKAKARILAEPGKPEPRRCLRNLQSDLAYERRIMKRLMSEPLEERILHDRRWGSGIREMELDDTSRDAEWEEELR